MKQIYFLFLAITISWGAQAQLRVPDELQDYYGSSTIDTSDPNQLKTFLADLTSNKHTTQLSYGQRHNFLYDADADPTDGSKVILMYSGEVRDEREYLSSSNSYSPQTFNTEHIYPQSKLSFGTAYDIGRADLHHLRSCDIDVNSARGSQPFDNNPTGSGFEDITDGGWYPGDEWIGDVARMVLYLNIRYDEPFFDVGSEELFLAWNAADPVSDFEIQRNSVITGAQGNRNPFIDNPYLATLIWGGDDAENRWSSTLSVETDEATKIRLYPNPATGNTVTILSNQQLAVEVFDILGKKVSTQRISKNQNRLNIASLKSGIYLLKLKTNESTETRKLIIR